MERLDRPPGEHADHRVSGDLAELDERPAHERRQMPARPVSAIDAKAWLEWFGIARLGLAALSVATIAIGMWWLLRAPPVPVEQTLPFATADGPASTMPPMSTTTVAGSVASESATTVAAFAVVHVAGDVERPGVYTLEAGSRVADAIEAAGGVSGDGDLDSLNLAALVGDGERIYVPSDGEVDPASIDVPGPSGGTVGAPGSAPSGPVNLNTAGVAELESLPGVGPATAAAIVDDRQRNGPFAAVEDLERVRGIGPAKLSGLIDLVTV